MSTATEQDLAAYLDRPPAAVAPEVLDAIASGPMDPALAADRKDLGRLLDPAPLPVETGWCRLGDSVGYVAVRTEMPGVTAEMIDWWFEWHPAEALRYQVWFPGKHEGNRWKPGPGGPGRKRLWGSVHYPVEDVGLGMQHLRIAFKRPTELGFPSDGVDHPDVGTIVCGEAGFARPPIAAALMTHVFLRSGDGLVLRSDFWLGALVRPAFLRRKAISDDAPRLLAGHCAQEYSNLASILPGLHERFGNDNDARKGGHQ